MLRYIVWSYLATPSDTCPVAMTVSIDTGIVAALLALAKASSQAGVS